MEDFSYPIKLEPLNRPVKRREVRPQQAAPKRKATPKPKPLGLREQRERKGVSLEEIAENTRIPLSHLQELERGDVSNWPAGVYAKSWARDYAKEAGIDEDRVIAIVAPIAEVEPTIDEIKQVREERERMRVAVGFPLEAMLALARRFAAIAVVLTLIALAAIFFFWKSDSRPEAPNVPATVGTSGTAPGESPR